QIKPGVPYPVTFLLLVREKLLPTRVPPRGGRALIASVCSQPDSAPSDIGDANPLTHCEAQGLGRRVDNRLALLVQRRVAQHRNACLLPKRLDRPIEQGVSLGGQGLMPS